MRTSSLSSSKFEARLVDSGTTIAEKRSHRQILLADYRPEALEPIGAQLQQLGYRVSYATDVEQALELARRTTPALVIMDLMLPDLAGFDLCRSLRRENATVAVPIIIVSAYADETNRVVAFELGADDFVTKPFSVRELMLRARKLLAQAPEGAGAEPEPLRFHDLVVDLACHAVLVEGAPIELTATEFRLLELLARRNGVVQLRSQLFREVWNFQPGVDSRTLDTHVRRLRRKLGAAGRSLETVRGVGYRFHRKSVMPEMADP